MLSDYTWNHTTLWAIKADPRLTYLQVGFADNFREQIDLLKARYPTEFLQHIEYMRMGSGADDRMVRGGAPLVRYTTEARLKEAAKLGFDAGCLPRRVARGNRLLAAPEGLRLQEIGHLSDLVANFTPAKAAT